MQVREENVKRKFGVLDLVKTSTAWRRAGPLNKARSEFTDQQLPAECLRPPARSTAHAPDQQLEAECSMTSFWTQKS